MALDPNRFEVLDDQPQSGNDRFEVIGETPKNSTPEIGSFDDPYSKFKRQELLSQNREDYPVTVPPSLNPNYDLVRYMFTDKQGNVNPLAVTKPALETVGGALKLGEYGVRKVMDLPAIVRNKITGATPDDFGAYGIHSYHPTFSEREALSPDENIIHFPRSSGTGVVAGLENTASDFATSMLGTPEKAVTLALTPTKGIAGRVAAGAYGSQIAAGLPESISKAYQLTTHPSPDSTVAQEVEAISHPVIEAALAKQMIGHAVGPTESVRPEVQGPYSLGRYLNMPKGAEPTLRVEQFEPLDTQSGSPIPPEELIARQSRTPTLPESKEPEIKTWNLDESQGIKKEDPYSNLKTALLDPGTGKMIIGEKGEDHFTIYNQLSPEGKELLGLDKPTQETRARNYSNRGWVTDSGKFVTLGDLRDSGGDIQKAVFKKESEAPNAPEIRQQPESNQPEHAGDAGERPSAQPGGGGSIAQGAPPPEAKADESGARSGDARGEGDQEVSRLTDGLSRVSDMTGEEFANHVKSKQGGLTGEAYRIGQSVSTPEELDDIKSRMDAEIEKSKKAKQEKDFKSWATSGAKGQFFREAYEAATGTGSAGKSLRDSNPNYKPPFPEGKPPGIVGMGAAKYGEVTGPHTPLTQLENQIHILSEQSPVPDKQREAFNLGEKVQTFKDGVSKNLQGLKAAGKYLQQKLIGKPVVTDIKRAIGNRHLALTDSAINARQFVDTAEKKIPSKIAQEAISDYVDTGGNEELLRKAAAETKPKYRAGYEKALNLTQDEKTVANNIREYFNTRLDDAIKNGVLEDGIEDYIHRYYQTDSPWKNGILAELRSGIFTGKPALAKQRVFDFDFEAEKAGLKPIKSFVKRVAAYDLSLNKAIADRNIVKEMSQIKMPDGRPMVDVAGVGIPVGEGESGATLIKPSAKPNSDNPIDNRNDYRPFDAPALRRWKWVGTDANGGPIMLQGDVLVHPDAMKDVRALFERSRVRANPIGRMALQASSTVKQTMLDISAFHPVQIAVHGLEHRSHVPFGEYDAKFLGKEFRPLSDYINDPDVRGLVRGGMVMGETTGRELFHEGLAGSSLTKHIPGLGPKLAQYSDWLFNDYIPRLKAETGLHALERDRKRYPNLTKEELYHNVANEMNAAFGEQNYEMIGRSKTTQDMLRLALLAPDFLESRLKFAWQGLTGIPGLKGYGKEQFAALMLGATTMYIVSRLLNKSINGEYHFEPQNAFSVIKNGKAYSLRTVQGDILQAATDPEKFLRHRLNPLYGRTAMEAVTQRDEFGRSRNAKQQLQDFAQTIVPISLRGLLNPREQNLLESTLNAVGITEHRASPTTLVYDLANKYKKEKGVAQQPGEFIYDPDKDPYRPIRQAAIFSNPQTVANEIDRAVKEGKKPADILQHFQRYATAPFVGSKKNETKFFNSLDSDNQKIYQDAKREKKKVLENINMGMAIWRRGNLSQ